MAYPWPFPDRQSEQIRTYWEAVQATYDAARADLYRPHQSAFTPVRRMSGDDPTQLPSTSYIGERIDIPCQCGLGDGCPRRIEQLRRTQLVLRNGMERYSARPSIYGRPIREDNWHVVEPPQPPSHYVPNIFAVQPAYEYNQMNYYQPPTYQVLPPPFYPSPRVVVPASHPQNVLFLKNVYQNSPSYTYERLKAYFQEFQGYKTLHLLWEFVDAAAVIFSNDPCTRWAAANVQGKYLNPARPLEAYVLDYNFVMPFHTCGPNCTFETR